MSIPSLPRLRVAAIDFLNPAPLMWDFEHEPQRSRLQKHYDIHYSMPSVCADQLFTGEAEIGLVPAAAYAMDPGMTIMPGCTIASKGAIRSIILVTREAGPEAAQTVALDTSSLTSAAYTRILFHRYWNRDAAFILSPPDLEAMLLSADAALLIGDPALLALKDREGRYDRTGEGLNYFDLGEEWVKRTGVPWVSAFWAIRGNALHKSPLSASQLISDFTNSRDRGLMHIDEIVKEWSQRIDLSPAVIRQYLTQNIHYVLDEDCLNGLLTFYRYAAECAALPAVQNMRMLEVDTLLPGFSSTRCT